MTSAGRHAASRIAAGLRLPPEDLLLNPLDYILADHTRLRVLCRLCDHLADAKAFDADAAERIVLHIDRDLALHVTDEEEDLFPLLRRRATEASDLKEVLGRLTLEHAAENRLANALLEGLRTHVVRIAAKADDSLRINLHAFSRSQHQHLALENATILPLSKVLLSKEDLNELAKSMAARRGITLPGKQDQPI